MKFKNYHLVKGALAVIMTICISVMSFAQVPQKFSYQAVVRNAEGKLVTNQAVGMKVSILKGSASGAVVYQEIYNPNPETNANGLLTLQIGSGVVMSGDFSSIDWSSGSYYVKTEIDPTGGTNYSITGTSQLLSVPFALRAAGPQILVNEWLNVTNFRNSNGKGSTGFSGELAGEKRWKVAELGPLKNSDVVTVYVKMRKASGEVPLTKAVPFDMELDNGMVVTFRNWVYDSSVVCAVLALKTGDIVDFNNFDFNAWQTAHEVQWRTVIIRN